MELLALYIAILALVVAIPGTIDATWNVIVKLRSLKKETAPRPMPQMLATDNSALDLIRLKLEERYKTPKESLAGSYRKVTKISPSSDLDIAVFQPFSRVAYPKKT